MFQRDLSETEQKRLTPETIPEGCSPFEQYVLTSPFQRELSHHQGVMLVASATIGRIAVADRYTRISQGVESEDWKVGVFHSQRDGFIDMRSPDEYRTIHFSDLYRSPELVDYQWFLKEQIESQIAFERRSNLDWSEQKLKILLEQYRKARIDQ